MLRSRPSLLLSAAVLPLVLLASCGGGKAKSTTPPLSPTTPTTQGSTTSSSTTTSAPRGYTANTTRIDAADPAAVAASVALTMYPSTAKDLRPSAVAFAGADDWRSILLASSFAAKPLGFPLLLTDDTGKLPPVSANALAQLQPHGAKQMNEAQGIRIGVSTRPGNFRTRYLTATTPAGLAEAVDAQLTKARGTASSRVLLVNSNDPASAAPAAAWAARSGDPILFTTNGSLPAETKAALATHNNPRVYVLGGPETVSSFVIRSLQEIPGVSVFRITPADATTGGPADLAIAFAKYSDRDMGFNYRLPGHGFMFASTKDPTSAMAAAALASGGQYPALLYVDRPDHVEASLRSYLLDEQPGYDSSHPATQGFYNHGWIIGPTTAIETNVQARIDNLLEIAPTDNPNALGDSPSTNTETEASPTQ